MFTKVKVFEIFLFAFLTITLIEKSMQQECSDSAARKIDGVMAKLLTIGNSGRRFPESKGEDLKIYCNDTKIYMEQIENYKTKCLKGLPKQIMSIIIYSVKNAINNLCKKDSKRLTSLIEATPCLNKGSNEINKCYTKFIDGILGAKNSVDSKKIPYNVCEYHKIFECGSVRLKKVNGCTDSHINTGIEFIRSLFGNAIDLISGEYTEGSDKCEKLGPAPKKKKSQRRTKSFLLPLMDLLSSFPEV